MRRKKYASSATTCKASVVGVHAVSQAISPAHYGCRRNKSPFARRYCQDSPACHRILSEHQPQGQKGRANHDVEAPKGQPHNSPFVVCCLRHRPAGGSAGGCPGIRFASAGAVVGNWRRLHPRCSWCLGLRVLDSIFCFHMCKVTCQPTWLTPVNDSIRVFPPLRLT